MDDNIALSTDAFNKQKSLLPDQTINNVKFHGDAGDYFSLWLKNIIFCILTLGIYLPWAMVSRRRYFMNATEINHTRFEYHAKPTEILFGFILTGVSLLLIPVLASVSPTLGLLMMLVVIILMPYALIRLWNFNVRNTSFREHRFAYQCNYMRLYLVVLILPVLLLVVTMVCSVMFSQWYVKVATGSAVDNVFRLMLMTSIIPLAGLFLIWSVQGKQLCELLVNNLSYNKTAFSLSLSYKRLMLISLITVLLLSPFVAAGFSQLSDLTFLMMIPEEVWTANLRAMVIIKISLFYLLFFCGAMTAGIYFRVSCWTYVINSMTLGNLRFRCNMTYLSYLFLILSNFLLIICTLGFGSAYADIRHARYLARHIWIVGDMDSISDSNKSETPADRSRYDNVVVSAD